MTWDWGTVFWLISAFLLGMVAGVIFFTFVLWKLVGMVVENDQTDLTLANRARIFQRRGRPDTT